MNRAVHSITKTALEHSKRQQQSEFPVSDRKWIQRNPPSAPMQCFDDTMVSLFEVALSLEIQLAFRETNISFIYELRMNDE